MFFFGEKVHENNGIRLTLEIRLGSIFDHSSNAVFFVGGCPFLIGILVAKRASTVAWRMPFSTVSFLSKKRHPPTNTHCSCRGLFVLKVLTDRVPSILCALFSRKNTRNTTVQVGMKRRREDESQTSRKMTICSRWLATILQFYDPRRAIHRPLVQVDIFGYRVNWGQRYKIGMEVLRDGSGLTLCAGNTPCFLLRLRIPGKTVSPFPRDPNFTVSGVPRHISRVCKFVCRRYALRPVGTKVV